MRLLCTKCQIEMSGFHFGAQVIETFGSPPEPYKLWYADEYKCPLCSLSVVAGFADKPAWEHFEGRIKLARYSTLGSEVFYSHEKGKA